MRTRLSRQVFGAVLLALLRPASEAAASSAGVVTGVSGQVTVSRTEASPLPLRFKDEVFLKDRISTALFVDDWLPYHIEVGEVHCGSLVRRERLGLDWWANQP